MLKKRLIPCLILRDGILVQSIEFKRYLGIGKPRFTIERFIDWDVDEIIFIDISATREKRGPSFELLEQIAKKCFVPLTIGGGITTIDEIKNVLKVGADKVVINTITNSNSEFISEASNKFGAQCIVVSIDAKLNNGKHEVYTSCGRENTGKEVVEWAKEVESLGAGEIFLTSIDKDGTKEGYDIKLVNKVANAVNIPVIACGGVGQMNDFPKGILEGNASAVSAANIFQHSEHATIKAKSAMKLSGIDVRLITKANYLDEKKFGRLEIK